MITSGYTMDLICDCAKCKNAKFSCEIAKAEYAGQTYGECAKQARANGWKLSRDKVYCSAPGHRPATS